MVSEELEHGEERYWVDYVEDAEAILKFIQEEDAQTTSAPRQDHLLVGLALHHEDEENGC
jgi:hypothetical protein